MTQLRVWWRVLRSLPRALPDLAADRFESHMIRLHKAVDFGPDHGPMCMAITHRDRPVKWPCDDLITVLDDRDARLVAGGQRWPVGS